MQKAARLRKLNKTQRTEESQKLTGLTKYLPVLFWQEKKYSRGEDNGGYLQAFMLEAFWR